MVSHAGIRVKDIQTMQVDSDGGMAHQEDNHWVLSPREEKHNINKQTSIKEASFGGI